MLLGHLAGASVYPYLIGLCIVGFVVRIWHNKYSHGLSQIRGPTIAAYTDLWRFWIVWGRRPELTHIELHEKYGSIVRLGPKTVSISDVEAVKSIYALHAGYVKVFFIAFSRSLCLVLTRSFSPVSTPCSKPSPKVDLFTVCSTPLTRSFMQNSVEPCPTP